MVAIPDIKQEVIALKRERIIQAAVELFYERGYKHTTLDAVANQLGVTKPFIYSHFLSKADLLAEICARGISASLDALNAVIDQPLPAGEKLARLCKSFVDAVLNAQQHIAIFTREEKNLPPAEFERISDLRRQFDRKLTALLEEGVASGEFRVDDTRITALAIGGMVSWAYVWYRPEGRLRLEEIAEAISNLVLTMVGAGPSTAPTNLPARKAAGRTHSRA